MVYSMTGYGKATGLIEASDIVITVEIKSLNSKYLDLNIRLPQKFKSKELELRSMLKQHLLRGKVDITISMEGLKKEQTHHLNSEVIINYYKELQEICNTLNLNDNKHQLINSIMRLPDVTKQENKDVSEAEWLALKDTLHKAVEVFTQFRNNDGLDLEKDLRLRAKNITTHLVNIEALAPLRITRMKDRLTESVQDNIKPENYDGNRFEQELIYYLEKLDITEEVVRLRSHCKHFLIELSAEKMLKGKKLGFFCQEIGREINTIGAKANDAKIQEQVVHMKDELEKMKEQVLNIM